MGNKMVSFLPVLYSVQLNQAMGYSHKWDTSLITGLINLSLNKMAAISQTTFSDAF